MKVLIVGSDKVYAIENCYSKYFKCMGVEVMHFPAQTFFYDYYQKNILNKIIFRSGMSGILKRINFLFKKAVEDFHPDTIWIFKGMEIFPESLEWARRRGIRLANYNPDNPFIFTSAGSGNKYVTDSIRLYHLHFTYNLEIQRELEAKYSARTAYLPFGFDIDESLYEECEKEAEILKLCFLGNPDKTRVDFLKKISAQDIAVDIYGNSWKNFISDPNISVYPPVYGKDFWRVLRKYRAQLNMMRIHNENSHNMRTFEVPGIGGIMITPKTTEHEMFFTDEKEVFFYEDEIDCSAAVKTILAFNATKAQAIRQNARNASLEKGFSYADRAASALEVIKSL